MVDPELFAEMSAEAERATPGSTDSLMRLRALGQHANTLILDIDDLDHQIKYKKEQLRKTLERDMTDLMDEAGVASVTVGNTVFDLDNYCKASIKADGATAEEAYNWLEDNQAGDLIKREVTVSFPKEYQAEAEALAEYARTTYPAAGVAVKRGVPWARLTSWVKEQLKLGQVLPAELLGINSGRYVARREVKEKRR